LIIMAARHDALPAHRRSCLQIYRGEGKAGQQRFRFHVLAKHGSKYAVCETTHPQSLIKAAHIRGRHTMALMTGAMGCHSAHHHAFDAHLFAINPHTHKVIPIPGLVERVHNQSPDPWNRS